MNDNYITTYTKVKNNILWDSNISLKAKGLYALIKNCLEDENFILTKDNIKNICSEGEKGFTSAWSELKDKGYLILHRVRNDVGYYNYIYELSDNISLDNTVNANQYGYVYFFQDALGNIKIGCSKNIDRRKKQLEIGQSQPLKLIKSLKVKEPSKVERFIHNIYKDKRIKGEWFKLNAKDIINIKALAENEVPVNE